jgi:hypothetical protein
VGTVAANVAKPPELLRRGPEAGAGDFPA